MTGAWASAPQASRTRDRSLDQAEELAANRRVDIVVLSKQSDAVRELIPEIVAKTPHLDLTGRPAS